MTHCERVLELLSDGREHSHHELYALNVVAHSRVAELRKRGYTINQRRVVGSDGEPDYLYSLCDARAAERLGPDGSLASQSEGGDPDQASGSASPPKQPPSLDSSGELHATDWDRTGDGSPDSISLVADGADEQLKMELAA